MKRIPVFLLVLCLALTAFGCAKSGAAEAKLTEGEMTPEQVIRLSLDVDKADVMIQAGDAWHVEYALLSEPEISQDGGTLTLREPKNKLNLNLGKLAAKPYVTVTVPDTVLESGDITCDVGNVSVRGVDMGSLSVTLDVGNVNLLDLLLGSLKAAVDTGNLELRGLKVESLASLHTDTGNIECERTSIGESISLEADTGNLELEQVTVPRLHALCDVGDMELEDVHADVIEAQTDTGDIRLDLPGSLEQYALDLQTDIGSVRVDDVKQDAHYITIGGTKIVTAKTDTGDVSVDFE